MRGAVVVFTVFPPTVETLKKQNRNLLIQKVHERIHGKKINTFVCFCLLSFFFVLVRVVGLWLQFRLGTSSESKEEEIQQEQH